MRQIRKSSWNLLSNRIKRLNHKFILISFLLILNFFFATKILTKGGIITPSKADNFTMPSNQQIKQMNFTEISDLLSQIAVSEGAESAYDFLKTADLAPNIDLHLLGHLTGDLLYKEKGIDAINICTDDFRNACSHSVVIGILSNEGEGSLPQIANACHKAPGGKGAYTMCFHGLGHGVLAYFDYELRDAVSFCEKTGTQEYGYQEYIECVGGTIMEMIAGVHDREAWEKKAPIYFKNDDPLYPCNSDFIKPEAKAICYVYLTPHLFITAGADLGMPTAKNFSVAFRYCNEISVSEKNSRSACFGGFGKEFVVLAQNRDVRKIDQMTKPQLETVYSWCLLADDTQGTKDCIINAVNSLYWGGENDRSAALLFCSIVQNPDFASTCYENLINNVGYFIDSQSYKISFCSELPGKYQNQCTNILN